MHEITEIILLSSTFSLDELQGARALVKAFFPEATVKIEEADPVSNRIRTDNFGAPGKRAEAVGLAGVIRIEMEGDGPPFAFWRVGKQVEDANSLDSNRTETIPIAAEDITKILAHTNIGKESSRNLLVKHALIRVLSQVCAKELPWGILTGIRPSKIVHKMDDQGIPLGQQMSVLTERYGIRPDKAELLQEIVAVQRSYLNDFAANPKHIALYLGIPFCPSRCSYCSFPAYPIDRERQALTAYLQALRAEILEVGEMMATLGLTADSLYLGGGTPTVLTVEELSALFGEMKKYLPLAPDLEFTVEAGRPDTLTPAKFMLMRDAGVNRLSVNPQTMHADTLKRIGRAHRVEDVLAAYELAREYSNWVINMDLILGLPGEGVAEVERTLELLQPLEPANLTVHTLALKRGSREWEQGYRHASAPVIEEMQNLTRNIVRGWGLRPYYLYRQKHIAGNLENIGYAQPGWECRYNIAIMEERQSVIGLGAGASSKVVNPDDYSLTNDQHPSDWKSYATRWQDGHAKRVQAFEAVVLAT